MKAAYQIWEHRSQGHWEKLVSMRRLVPINCSYLAQRNDILLLNPISTSSIHFYGMDVIHKMTSCCTGSFGPSFVFMVHSLSPSAYDSNPVRRYFYFSTCGLFLIFGALKATRLQLNEAGMSVEGS
jgi:hypothetical protein